MSRLSWFIKTLKKSAETHEQFLLRREELFKQFMAIQSIFLQRDLATDLLAHQHQSTSAIQTNVLFNREQLIAHSQGKVSSIFGSQYQDIDNMPKRIRLPLPPFLMVDRVIEMEGSFMSLEGGRIITETDLNEQSWFLYEERIPLGFLLEGAQGQLLLLSWLGWDFRNKGSKVYRMLGGSCKLLGEYPKYGEIIKYDIRIYKLNNDNQNIIELDYDCYVGEQLILTVRNAKVGFFSEQELQTASGVLWDPEKIKYHLTSKIPSPMVCCEQSQFSQQQLDYFVKGDLFSCFGQGFELANTFNHAPRIANGRMQLIDEIQLVDPNGGPWRRGYIRAVKKITPDDWFFKCHFIDDPIMPGTLSIEAFIQTMAFYLTSLGYSLDKDGWRFEVVPNIEYTFVPRGQVVPATQGLIYEVFVEEVISEPFPTLFASVLATTFEGIKVYQMSHFGLRLIPDGPLSRHKELCSNTLDLKAVIDSDGIRLDYNSFLESALGKPSRAFGENYKPYDLGKKMPRTPSPPFLFMSRVEALNGAKGSFKADSFASISYDIPKNAWYFEENGQATMPFCVLIEAILQSAGWFSIYIGSVFQNQEESFIRNLNGTMKLLKTLSPQSGTIKTKISIINISTAGSMIIESFALQCCIGDEVVCEGTSSFGLFSKEALDKQVGLPSSEEQTTPLHLPSNIHINFNEYPQGYFRKTLFLAHGRLQMLDRVTGFWPSGGKNRLGLLRAEKDVNKSDWFFKAHFYRDPVQPGSLGLEGMIQLLQFYLMEQTGWEDFIEPSFEVPALGETIDWKYRGQVLPTNNKVIYTLEIDSFVTTPDCLIATAVASLWVDGKRIYEADFGGRLFDKLKGVSLS